MIRRSAAAIALSLVLSGCADKLTGPQAQAAAREYQSKTVAGDQIPLIFVDGKEMSADSMKAFPAERIESVEVIKGARALELHGPRAANGVIYVASKKT